LLSPRQLPSLKVLRQETARPGDSRRPEANAISPNRSKCFAPASGNHPGPPRGKLPILAHRPLLVKPPGMVRRPLKTGKISRTDVFCRILRSPPKASMFSEIPSPTWLSPKRLGTQDVTHSKRRQQPVGLPVGRQFSGSLESPNLPGHVYDLPIMLSLHSAKTIGREFTFGSLEGGIPTTFSRKPRGTVAISSSSVFSLHPEEKRSFASRRTKKRQWPQFVANCRFGWDPLGRSHSSRDKIGDLIAELINQLKSPG